MTIKQIMAVLNQEIAWCRKHERAGAKKMPAKEYRRGYKVGLIQARALLRGWLLFVVILVTGVVCRTIIELNK